MTKIWAKIENDLVIDIISADDEFIETLRTMEIDGKTDHHWIDTTDCKNSPSVGSAYRADINAFVQPKPYTNAVWDETVYDWIPPVAKPDNNNWFWDQAHHKWIPESKPS